MLKTILGALALVIAAPVAAQSAPAGDPHAGHAEHGQQGNEQQRHQGHQSHQGHQGHQEHGRHMKDCRKDCSDEAKQGGKAMSCCDKHGEAAPDGAADHSQHSN